MNIARAVPLGTSQMSDILNGKIKKPPSWDVTAAIVGACLDHAARKGRFVPPDLADESSWRSRHADLEHDHDAMAQPGLAAGWPLARVNDPFALEVHRPVRPGISRYGLPTLPTYIPRAHDAELKQVVTAAAEGTSAIAVLVGGSSTGKTRACWESLQLLRNRRPEWRLWHPIDPSRPEAALRELPAIGPRTVVWLNEAQFYLDTAGDLGERVASGLRELLRDPDRGPVLVLATLWPQFWGSLSVRPEEGPDPHAQARELLSGQDISLPPAFSQAQLQLAADSADPRLALAAATALDGQVIQFLAGAPEVLARYRNAPPAARALIEAAMDARRLGMGVALPQDFLAAAAPAYLPESERDGIGDDWLPEALAWSAAECKGTRGPLTHIRRYPTHSPDPALRLADYLDQHGRHERSAYMPPAEFWAAAAEFASPHDQDALAAAAEERGLLRDAARLCKRATHGEGEAAIALFKILHSLQPDDSRPARWVSANAALDDAFTISRLIRELQTAGAADQATALASRAVPHVRLDDPLRVNWLLEELRSVGAADQVEVLLARNPAARATLRDPDGVARLLHTLKKIGAAGQVEVLLARNPAAHVTFDYPNTLNAVADLLYFLKRASATDQVTTLAVRAAAHITFENAFNFGFLLQAMWHVGASEQADTMIARAISHSAFDSPRDCAELLKALWRAAAGTQPGSQCRSHAADQTTALLARDPAAQVTLDQPYEVARLFNWLCTIGATTQAALLAARAAAQAPIDDAWGIAGLLRELRKAGAAAQVNILLARNPAAHATADDLPGVAALLRELREAGATHQTEVLAARAAAHVLLDHPWGVGWLMGALKDVGAADQVEVLLARNPAAHTPVDDAGRVAALLRELRAAGAAAQVDVLLARDPAAHATIDKTADVAGLLRELREAGATDQAEALTSRASAVGRFDIISQQGNHQRTHNFGREADGSPAPPWSWDDLD